MSAPARFFCRDCLTDHETKPGARISRCPACASPRLLAHPERDELAIAHVDCDAFYASVEKRDDPSLRDKPVIVGGGKRGVVSTCCYIARIRGVRSAMPMFKALDLCPDAVVIRPAMSKYAEVGRAIRAMMQDLTPLVEPLSIDEAFLDLTGTALLHHASPAVTLGRFAKRVEMEIGVTVSVGLSYCKFLAKFASELDKPRGFAIVGRAEAVELLAPHPVGRLWGVGKVARERLEKEGLHTIGDIQAREETQMMRLYGGEGQRLWRLARGIDHRRVEPQQDSKSVSNETTFDTDIADPARLVPALFALAEKVSARLKAEGIAGKVVTLKLKTPDFRLRTRQRPVPATQLASRIFAAGRDMLEKEADGAKFRLIGIGVSDLVPAEEADRGDLLDANVEREKNTERAMDALRQKFGKAIVQKGLTFTPRRAPEKD